MDLQDIWKDYMEGLGLRKEREDIVTKIQSQK